jgi:D-alanyl-D-alanine dipeptidase
VPERRVPTTIRFRERPVRPVPGQPGQQLFGEACDAFLRMREAARQDGVELFILSSWRSRARQAAASAKQPNPKAVARKTSAHMYGLAIDLRMGVAGLPVAEINTRVDRATAAKLGTAAKMGNLVRMYRSPVYKWMSLRAREFGWYPYRNEPWHWEYNPPGLKARFEGGANQELEQAAVTGEPPDTGAASEEYVYEEAASPSLLRTFSAKALGVKVAILVTQAARTSRQVEMLVFAHGLDLCRPVRKNRPATFVTDPPFHLGKLVEASGRPIVLMVPFLDWEHMEANGMAFGKKWHRLAQPAVFNAVAAEALEQVRALTGSASAPALRRLILSGHSRAYGFFDALAHASDSPQMRSGALGRPLHIWALDTTYSAPIADWSAWLQSREDLQATVVYRHGTYQPSGSASARELPTGIRGRQFGGLAARSQGRLTVMPVAAGKVSHCAIPNVYLPGLLAALPPLTTGEPEAKAEAFGYEEGEDLAGLEAEAQALATSDETAGEWGGGLPGEAEGAPGRFDEFGDARDLEWSSESSEELKARDKLAEEREQPLSFEYGEQETSLARSGLTPAEQRAVEITSVIETGTRGGFNGLTPNTDGQGLSFGLVNWTIGTGSLQPLLRDFARDYPANWAWVFGADASSFLQLISREGEEARKEQLRFAVEQMNTVSAGPHGKRIWTVRQPWAGYFSRLAEDRAFQKIQLRYVRVLLAAAAGYCRRFHFTSERAFCFMFDAVASHGKGWLQKKFGGVERRRDLVRQAFDALAARFGVAQVPESEALLAIADVLATTSAQRWADKVRRRKRWFVTGRHPREHELQGLRPRADVPYSTSGATAGQQESLSPERYAGEWEDSEADIGAGDV